MHQVRWHPSSDNIFASADYDGSVKVWDTRAAIPLGATKVPYFNFNFNFNLTTHIHVDAYVHALAE
jgi:WD40 repeat protein